MELSNQSITSLRKQLSSGDICSADIVSSIADAIEKKDGEVGAYLSHDLDAAKEAAKTADLSLPLGGSESTVLLLDSRACLRNPGSYFTVTHCTVIWVPN